MFAVIKFKNNQYKVAPDQIINLPSFDFDEKNKTIKFDQVLLVSDGEKIEVGNPCVSGVSVEANILEKIKSDKVRVFKFRAKKRYKKTLGQRQDLIRVKINKINFK